MRWQYLTVEIKPTMWGVLEIKDVQSELTKQGALGWELVNLVVPAPMYAAIAVFKKAA